MKATKHASHPVGFRTVTLVLAASTGITVANIYYCQPLLGDMATTMHASDDAIGAVTVATQIGTAIGTFLFVPLGDMLERRRLIVVMCIASGLALAAMAIAPTLPWLVAVSLSVGLTAIIPHLLIPFAAQLSPDEERGRIVGMMVSGLLAGIVASRVASGVLAGLMRWQAVYVIGGALMLVLAAVLARVLPNSPPAHPLTYRKLLGSVLSLAAAHPEIRSSAWSGAILFGAFNAFWTTFVFLLAEPPFEYGASIVGLFGLGGAASAAVAPSVGRFVDRRSADAGVILGATLTGLAFLTLWMSQRHIVGIAIAVILLDVGVQAAHVANQARLYAIFTTNRSRAVTVYMVTYFVGGALGCAVGLRTFTTSGWSSVCVLGMALAVLACLPAADTFRQVHTHRRRTSRAG